MSPEVRATYRVQLHKDFDLDAAAAIVPYLAELGISHLYCSPYLQSRAGSTHGYDVVDHGRINDELGGAPAHERLVRALNDHDMGHILDVVPNHMTVIDRANEWWWDVLRHGPRSRYAAYFDIDWDPPESKLKRTILIPILGDHYGRVLDAGDITVERDGDEILVRYFEHVLPLDPATLGSASLEGVNADTSLLHEVLERQHYRLAYWRTAGEELNYRRFFSINDLAALRMDNPNVFDDVHRLVVDLVRDGRLDGLRIDHIDGLRDPEGYLSQVRSWAPDTYIVVEKILEPGEDLRTEWPIEGTTGYDFLNHVSAAFIDGSNERAFTELYNDFVSEDVDIRQLRRDKKVFLMKTELATDIERLTELFASVCEGNREFRDFTRHEMRTALRETIAWFPVYRTYVNAATGYKTEQDVAYVREATKLAAEHRPQIDESLLGFLSDILLLNVEGENANELAMRFQQTTGPVMAKGVEDTTLYIYNRFVAANEVGGDPAGFGSSISELHDSLTKAQRERPLAMLATSTHDTKRSEDVRARLALLSEMPDRWGQAVVRWRELNERYRRDGWPDRNMEYLLYQTLVGAWPLSPERALAYIEKAAREAKVHTSWTDPDERYESALRDFVSAILDDARFTEDLAAFCELLVVPGRVTSLAQTLVKLTAPGVPDIYQGTETWDLSLVDPDNRRPVDHAGLNQIVQSLNSADDARARDESGGPKLFVIKKALEVRRRFPEAFGQGSAYRALSASGTKKDHVIAFARSERIVAVVPRLVWSLGDDWDDTELRLPEGRWHDAFSGDTFEDMATLSSLTERLPVALLVRLDAGVSP